MCLASHLDNAAHMCHTWPNVDLSKTLGGHIVAEETQTTDLQEQVDALASDNEKMLLTEHAYKQVLTKLGIDVDTCLLYTSPSPRDS